MDGMCVCVLFYAFFALFCVGFYVVADDDVDLPVLYAACCLLYACCCRRLLQRPNNLQKPNSKTYKKKVDPLDGTTNFVHGYPFSCVCVGLSIKQEPVVGVVYNPILNELFAARRGGGAFLNGERISVSGTAGALFLFVGVCLRVFAAVSHIQQPTTLKTISSNKHTHKRLAETKKIRPEARAVRHRNRHHARRRHSGRRLRPRLGADGRGAQPALLRVVRDEFVRRRVRAARRVLRG